MDTQTDNRIETGLRGYGGRPRKFTDMVEVKAKIAAYFASLEPRWVEVEKRVPKRNRKGGLVVAKDGRVQYKTQIEQELTDREPPTVTGLAMALETTRQTLINYEEAGLAEDATEFEREFLDTIRAAKLAVEEYNAQNLASGSVPAAGVIFTMINNHGWKQASEIKTSGEQTVKLERGMTDAELADLVARTAGSSTRPGTGEGQGDAGAGATGPQP